jgi:mono/diheme cytochrome c family protein
MHISGLSYLANRLFDFDTTPYAGTAPNGAEIPASISRAAAGSRGDVETAAFFNPATNMWTVEFRRARDTGNTDDHQFTGTSLAPPTQQLIQSGNAINGQTVYEFNCIGCHQPQGRGSQSGGMWAFPRVQRASSSMIHSAIENVAMMSVFSTFLTDQEIEDVATYLQQQESFRPTLEIANLAGGSVASLTVGGATAGDTVYFAYSLAGAGPTATPWGFSLDLGAPYSQIGAAPALADGTATISTPVPGAATGLHVWVQGVVRSGNSFAPSMVIDAFVQ